MLLTFFFYRALKTDKFISIIVFISIITVIMVIKMNTTISISKETRDKIMEFGIKGDTYDQILERLYESAKQRQIQDILMNTENCLTIKEAREKLKKNG
jgi:DNA-binding LacI/PurR family transcriptional regulator